jgi:hypothetical protein
MNGYSYKVIKLEKWLSAYSVKNVVARYSVKGISRECSVKDIGRGCRVNTFTTIRFL